MPGLLIIVFIDQMCYQVIHPKSSITDKCGAWNNLKRRELERSDLRFRGNSSK